MADHHDHSTGDYVPGDMDIEEHKSTYELFGNMTKWGSLVIAVALVFLVLLTCVPGTGFLTSAGVSIVMAIAGWAFLRTKPDTH